MSKFALVVREDLSSEIIDIEGQELRKLQGVVDGLIEAVQVKPNITMWVNEEGLFRQDLGRNHFGSTVLSILAGVEALVRGDIVFTAGPNAEGETLGLTEQEMKEITFLAKQAKEAIF